MSKKKCLILLSDGIDFSINSMTLDLLVKLRHDMVVVQMVYPKKANQLGGIFPGSEFVAHRLYQITLIFLSDFQAPKSGSSVLLEGAQYTQRGKGNGMHVGTMN